MKRSTKLVVLLVLLAILCSVLAGCCSGSDKKAPQIVYGKKYGRLGAAEGQNKSDFYSCFVFEENNVGYFYYVYTGAKTDFIWEVAEDGLVYLFPTKVTSDDGTVSEPYYDAVPLSGSFTFGDGFMIWTGGSGSTRYVLEGSALAESIEKE